MIIEVDECMTKSESEDLEYLKEIVSSVTFPFNIFYLRLDDEKYIFTISPRCADQDTIDYYSISAIYDTIYETDEYIKYAFSVIIDTDLSQTILEHDPFSRPGNSEKIAIYHTENIVFRVSILWDLYAQLFNIIYKIGSNSKSINYQPFFNKCEKNENTTGILKVVNEYITQEEGESAYNNKPWEGNHKFLRKYRNEMTHRLSPNVTSVSNLGITLRHPTLFVLHRAVEDYFMVSNLI